MRIVGGRDYYDGAMAYGQDQTVVFVRHKDKTIPSDELPLVNLRYKPYDICVINVYFAGKLYVGLRTPHFETRYTYAGMGKYHYFWDAKSFLEYMKKSAPLVNFNLNETSVHDFFNNNGKEDHRDLLIKKRITIAYFILSGHGLRYNLSENVWNIDSFDLKSIEFAKVKDPFTAFQEIAMWISGVLPMEPPNMVKIVDEDIRIAKRGFDPKTSFRKEPTKKNGKRIKS